MAARSCSASSCYPKVTAKGSQYHPNLSLLFPSGFCSGGRRRGGRRGGQSAHGCGGGSRRLAIVCGGGSANGGEESEGRLGNVGDREVRTLLIDNYDSYTYNIYQELAVVNGVAPVVVRNDEWSWEFLRHQVYDEGAFDNIVISPGPGSPACPQDVGVCLQVLMLCEDIPILGVCLGHQALGFVHGAKVVHAPEPIHGRLSEIEHAGCKLFNGIPSGSKSGFKVVRYHSLVVDPNSLPDDLVPIAWTCPTDMFSFLEIQNLELSSEIVQKPKNHQLLNDYFARDVKLVSSGDEKIIMGIRHSTRPHYGVQFHPESIATCHGRAIFKNFKSITLNHGLRSLVRSARKIQNSDKLQSVPISLSQSKQKNEKLPFKTAVNGHAPFISQTAMIFARSKQIKHLKLRWRRFCGLADHIGGSEGIFLEFFGNDLGNNTFWLDSASNDLRRARFSFMGGGGGHLWKQIKFSLSGQSANCGGYLTIRDAKGLIRETYLKDGFLAFLDEELQSFRYDKEDYEGLPFDFHGGFVGFLGYNMKVECGASSNAHKSKMPDACFFFADNLIVIDHSNNDVYVIRIHDALLLPPAVREINNWFDETERRLFNLKPSTATNSISQRLKAKHPQSCEKNFICEKSRHHYIKDVEKCLELIRDGESYELCLTTQMKVKVKDVNPLKLYFDLRTQNPAPYASWLKFSEENLAICCSSPERFLRLNKDDMLEAKPIKGTIARGKTSKEDEHLRLQLQYSEKDQAENLMIVDLLRNDLGRVCEAGTVHVPRLMEVESYATVHTLVSTVRGKKNPGLSAIDCIRAAFPGGSMTGAPKLRSMDLLDSIECSCRGIYSGSIGYISYNQKFDLNIVIRTVVINEEEASIGAGGAIVALSSPEDEYEEMLLKARAPSKAVERQLTEMDSHGKSFLTINN